MPDDKNEKDVLILYTDNENLVRKLSHWAYQTDSVLLYNPSGSKTDKPVHVFAIVADNDLIPKLSVPERASEKVIPSELNYDLIETMLNSLKPAEARRLHAVKQKKDGYRNVPVSLRQII